MTSRATVLLPVLLFAAATQTAVCQVSTAPALNPAANGSEPSNSLDKIDSAGQVSSPIAALELSPEKVSHLNKAIAEHDYVDAEKLLLAEIEAESKIEPHSKREGRLLAYTGSVYFLNHDYLNAAIAWKKSDAIKKLDASLQFSLAMSYVEIGHVDWARKQLESLAAEKPKDALYPYWLGRLDYDAQHYEAAISRFKEAIALDAGMARAYDNLGLCYFYRNENDLAIENYKRAIELDGNEAHPSAWPYLNLATTLEFVGRTKEAESDVRMALHLDPQSAVAHYRLGTVLIDQEQPQAALPELLEAAKLDPKYAEPHVALAQLYKKLGKMDAARDEVRIYQQLHGLQANTKNEKPPG